MRNTRDYTKLRKVAAVLCSFAVATTEAHSPRRLENGSEDIPQLDILKTLQFDGASEVDGMRLIEISTLAQLSADPIGQDEVIPGGKTFAAISDNSDPPRYFTVTFDGCSVDTTGDDFMATWEAAHRLTPPTGLSPFDTEGIAVWPRGAFEDPDDVLLITTDSGENREREGTDDGARYVPASVHQYDLEGNLLGRLKLPELLTSNKTGYYLNRGFEAADIAEFNVDATGHGIARLIFGGEFALAADIGGEVFAPIAGFGASSSSVPIRLMEYESCVTCDDVDDWTKRAEYVYNMKDRRHKGHGTGNGLVELVFLPGDDEGNFLLAMERGWYGVSGQCVILLYLVDLRGATNVCGCDSLIVHSAEEESRDDDAASPHSDRRLFKESALGDTDPDDRICTTMLTPPSSFQVDCAVSSSSFRSVRKILLANITRVAADQGLNLGNLEAVAVVDGSWNSSSSRQQFRLVALNDNGADLEGTPTYAALFDLQFATPSASDATVDHGDTDPGGDANDSGIDEENKAEYGDDGVSKSSKVFVMILFVGAFTSIAVALSLVVWHFTKPEELDTTKRRFTQSKQRYESVPEHMSTSNDLASDHLAESDLLDARRSQIRRMFFGGGGAASHAAASV